MELLDPQMLMISPGISNELCNLGGVECFLLVRFSVYDHIDVCSIRNNFVGRTHD